MGLLGYVALAEFFAFLTWLAGQNSFVGRSNEASAMFLNLITMAMPILAVLIATKIQPALEMARLFVTVALVEYAVSIVLGVITFLIGIGNLYDVNDGLGGTRDLILSLAAIVLIAIAGYLTYAIFSEMGGRISGPRATYGEDRTTTMYQAGAAAPTYPPQGGPSYPPPGPSYPPAGSYPPPGSQYPPAGPQYPPPGTQYPGGR
jgi:hypothetical protein